MYQAEQINHFMQRTLFVLLSLIATCMCFLALEKFTRLYKVNIVARAQQRVHDVRFARTPVLTIGKTRLSVMAINFHADPRRRLVILRDLTSNQLTTLRVGESTPQAVKVRAINERTVTLGYGSSTVTMSIDQ